MRCNVCGKEINSDSTLCEECKEKRKQYLMKQKEPKEEQVVETPVEEVVTVEVEQVKEEPKKEIENTESSNTAKEICSIFIILLLLYELAALVFYGACAFDIVKQSSSEWKEGLKLFDFTMIMPPIVPALYFTISSKYEMKKLMIVGMILTILCYVGFVITLDIGLSGMSNIG